MNQPQQSSAALVTRPASFNDIPYIQQIAYDTWPAAYGNILSSQQLTYMLNLIYSTEALTRQMKDNHHFFMVMFEYEPIGFASFNEVDNLVFKLQKLYVLPQKQKTGAGKLLLQTVEQIAESMGGTKLQLNVNRQNPSLAFYKRKGFSIIKEEDIDIGSGYFMNDYVMEKSL